MVFAGAQAVTGAVTEAGAAPQVAAGQLQAQVSSVAFSATPRAGVSYTISVNGNATTVAVGETVNGSSVTADWAAVLAALKFKLDTVGVVSAAFDAALQTLTLTAVQTNLGFSVSASGARQQCLAAAGHRQLCAGGARPGARQLRPEVGRRQPDRRQPAHPMPAKPSRWRPTTRWWWSRRWTSVPAAASAWPPARA